MHNLSSLRGNWGIWGLIQGVQGTEGARKGAREGLESCQVWRRLDSLVRRAGG